MNTNLEKKVVKFISGHKNDTILWTFVRGSQT